jgi:hypothetical protein
MSKRNPDPARDLPTPGSLARDASGPPRIAITWETVTPESAAEGDTDDSGWDYTPDEAPALTPDDDPDPDLRNLYGGPIARAAVRQITRDAGAVEASSWPSMSGRVWYTESDPAVDFRTGTERRRSFHLYGFTPREERAIFAALTGRVPSTGKRIPR